MILISGILATLITYIIAILLYFGIQNIGKYPENFYEKQIPKIEAYIHEKNMDLLYVRGESGLNNIIRGNGIMYQVLNSDCEVLYGTYKERVFSDTDKLIDKINTTFVLKGRFAYIVPIGNGTNIEGAVILLYKLGNPYKNIRIIIAVIAMLSPFLYFIIFTRLFSTSLVKKINFPLQLLIEASQKIKEKDLDFEVNYQSDNELGKLCTAFSEMKDELKKFELDATEIKFENTISRATGIANPRQIERAIKGMKYHMSLVYNIEDENEIEEDFETLKTAFKLLKYDYLGAAGSRGYGRVDVHDLDVKPLIVNDKVNNIVESCKNILKEV